MDTLFTHRHKTEGKVGIGKLPNELIVVLDEILNEYYKNIPDKTSTTYHTYYTNLNHSLKKKFDKIQYHPFWNNVCDKTNNCIKECVFEMNEIYYSNPKPNFDKINLYGAAANLIPHTDCILYNFNGINFYRIIIGLTENNNDTITEFVNLDLKHTINKGDYMIFNFDKTLHQVKKTGQKETPRVLLKLHFIVCESCKYSKSYVNFISNFYKYYYYIARYTEQIGTDPKSFMGFFFGILWEYPFYPVFKYIIFLLLILSIVISNVIFKIELTSNNTKKIVLHSFLNIFIIYLLIVTFFYFRYKLFNIR